MGKPEPWLANDSSITEAHPDIKSIKAEVEEHGDFPPHFEKHMRKQYFHGGNIPANVTCHNPRCHDGGLNLERTVYFMSQGRTESKQFAYHCHGHEKMGKKRGPMCSNTFDIRLTIEYDSK